MLSFSKDLWLLSFHNQRTFQRTKTFTLSMRFCTSRDVSSSRKLPQTKSSFIKDVYHKQIFFLHQGSFPQAKISPSSRKLSTNQCFSFIKEVFHKERFSLKEVFHKQIFFHKSRFFLNQWSFPQAKTFL